MKTTLLFPFLLLIIYSCSEVVVFEHPISEDGTYTDSRDGKVYETIKINEQIWMAENLAYQTNSGCWPAGGEADLVETFGYLYNWETAQKVVPEGWHLPSDKEWNELIDYLGGIEAAGGKLKETTLWGDLPNNPNIGATNESNFTALPAGFRGANESSDWGGQYVHFKFAAIFWTSTSASSNMAWTFSMYNHTGSVLHDKFYRSHGFSIRCIKD